MKIINIVKDLPWEESNGTMDKKLINTVVIHHSGTDRPLFYNSIKRYKSEADYHIKNTWNHISYHYIIDNIGDIYQCLPETEIGYHCGHLILNRRSIAVCFDGNMDKQKPTAKQIQAYKELMVWLTTKRPDLPKVVRESIIGHKDIKPTKCPGKNIYSLISKF